MNRVQMIIIDLANIEVVCGTFDVGLWQLTTYLSAAEQSSSFWTSNFGASFDDMDFPDAPVSTAPQLNINNLPLTEYSSIGDLRIANKGYYFDSVNQKIIVKYPGFDFYKLYETTVDETFGIVDKAVKLENNLYIETTYNGVYYEPRLIGQVADKRSVDNILQNRMLFDGFNLSVINTDGKFDNLRSRIVGAEARFFLAESLTKEKFVSDDFDIVSYGRVEDVSYSNPNTMSVRVSDIRKDWENTINTEVFTSADYTGIDDNLKDKRKPIALGPVINAPLSRILADTETNYTRRWFVCSPILGATSVSQVYQELDGVRTSVSSGDYTYTSSTGEVVFTADRDDNAKFFADITGSSVKIDSNASVAAGNLIDMALTLILQYTDREYNSFFFDTGAIDLLREDAKEGGYYIESKGIKLKACVEFLLSSNNIRIQPINDVLTMSDLSTKESTYEIMEDELVNSPAGWSFNNDFYFSSIRCKFSKDITNDTYQDYYDASLVDTAVENNFLEVDYEFETALTSRTDAEAISDVRYSRYTEVPRIVNVSLTSPLEFELFDFVTLTLQRPGFEETIVPRSDYEVIGISKSFRTATLLFSSENPADTDILEQRYTYNDNLYNEETN